MTGHHLVAFVISESCAEDQRWRCQDHTHLIFFRFLYFQWFLLQRSSGALQTGFLESTIPQFHCSVESKHQHWLKLQPADPPTFNRQNYEVLNIKGIKLNLVKFTPSCASFANLFSFIRKLLELQDPFQNLKLPFSEKENKTLNPMILMIDNKPSR